MPNGPTKKKLDDYSKDELIALVKDLRKRKKFGLVWEAKPEDVVEQCKRELPVLEQVENRAINQAADRPTNLIIEGDNYHALSVLNYTHAGKIDLIYADPPYNTGAKDWKYNNNYVDINDGYRHSKWLSMMESRLLLAKNLLREDGIICVTIDDYEVARVTILMEAIFGEVNHLGTVVIRNNPAGRSTEKGFSITHEYALFFAKSSKVQIGRLKRTEAQIARYSESDSVGAFEWVNFRKHGATRSESPRMFYPIFLSPKTLRIPEMSWNGAREEWDLLEKPKKNEIVALPIDENRHDRRWKWSVERARKEVKEMKVRRDRHGLLAVYIKSRLNDKGMLPLTWWERKEYSATAYGTNMLKAIFGELQVFSYPKSLYAVMDCLRIMTGKQNAVVLDFFAGSGTTGHATLSLNKEDNGQRQFILVTNNENKIAEQVTYPRIKKVIEGVPDLPDITGIPANVRYFKTAFVAKDDVSDDTRRALVERSTEMICVREGTFSKNYDNKKYKVYHDRGQVTGILFDLDALDEFKQKLNKTAQPASIYVFSLTNDTFTEDFEDLAVPHTLCPIPESILEVYRRIFSQPA